ncbi:MAG: transglutaminase-like domain-containing protein [Actinomycetota bacterium]|nr:transglutaminase-like domain-containing protein [Actinomycetota bacterium]
MRRELRSSMTVAVTAPTAFVLANSPAQGVPLESERLTVSLAEPGGGSRELAVRELDEDPLTRLQLFEAAPGIVTIDYETVVLGRAAAVGVHPIEAILYLRPSRYVQSDTLTPFARETFSSRDAARLVREVSSWVHAHLEYTAEATTPTGGAVETLAARAGVCRDYAHLTAALLRALDVPARLVSVYAPQLDPMDFHAVVEALVDGRWVVVDSTRLAPRAGMVRMATGRDATDTAWLTNTLSDVQLLTLFVDATSDDVFTDDPDELVALS